MKAVFLRCGVILMAASLAGCTANLGGGGRSGMDVTRFHLGQPVARGQIAIEPVNPADLNSLEFAQYATAVERELTRNGWTVIRGNNRSEQVAMVNVEQGSREAMAQRSSVSVGVGGGTGGFGRSGAGVGVGVGIPIGRRGSNELVATELAVRIQRRSDATVAWEGRATTEARVGSPMADRRAAVDRLAEALFRDFPGESGRTIRVQ